LSDREPGLELELPARAENVALVRHAVAGLGEALGMDPISVADLKTVVTEACMNVVVHAYGGGEGPLEVEVSTADEALWVTVRDQGSGIRPQPDLEGTSLRLGLPLIAALSSSFEIRGGLGQGTEVRMSVALVGAAGEFDNEWRYQIPASVESGTVISVVNPALVGPVLSRVISILATRAAFSVDRLSDAMLLGDAIAAQGAAGFPERRVRLLVEDHEHAIGVRIGPMLEGEAERIRRGLELPGLGASLEGLADEVEVDRDRKGEYLTLRLAQTARA
jgi:anti-sigma regulatory factor (Ser/Thr protein kinase)